MVEEHPWARELRKNDIPAVCALLMAPDVRLAFGWSEPPAKLDVKALAIRRSSLAGRYNRTWLLGLHGREQIPVGLCNAWGDSADTVELAYALAPFARGNRRMRMFLRLILPRLFHESTVHKVFAEVDSENLASRRTLEALGFTPSDRTENQLTFALARTTFLA
jgi:RimJ/RimL family protein N-acetyltransferase